MFITSAAKLMYKRNGRNSVVYVNISLMQNENTS